MTVVVLASAIFVQYEDSIRGFGFRVSGLGLDLKFKAYSVGIFSSLGVQGFRVYIGGVWEFRDLGPVRRIWGFPKIKGCLTLGS